MNTMTQNEIQELEGLTIVEAERQLKEFSDKYPISAREMIYELACYISKQKTKEWLA